MHSNKDMQDLFEFQTRQRLQASQEECLKLFQAIGSPAILSDTNNSPYRSLVDGYNTAYRHGYQNGYLDGFNKGMEYVANEMKNWADAEEDKDGQS